MDAKLYWSYSTESLKTNTLEIGIIAEGKADFLSKGFRKLSTKKGKKVIENNKSLAAFVISIEKLRKKN